MIFTLTARHFKAHDNLKEYAEAEADKLRKYYEDITRCEVILSFDKPENSIKYAEIIAKTNNNHTFTSKESSNDFKLSMEVAFEKVGTQVKKFKDKLKNNHTEKIQAEEDLPEIKTDSNL